jgi:hypothetical protein
MPLEGLFQCPAYPVAYKAGIFEPIESPDCSYEHFGSYLGRSSPALKCPEAVDRVKGS